MVAQSTAVSISVSSTGFTVTWSGSSADVTWYVYIYYSTTSTGTYTILTSANYTTASETGDTKTISYSPVGTYYYKATVTTGGPDGFFLILQEQCQQAGSRGGVVAEFRMVHQIRGRREFRAELGVIESTGQLDEAAAAKIRPIRHAAVTQILTVVIEVERMAAR